MKQVGVNKALTIISHYAVAVTIFSSQPCSFRRAQAVKI